MTGKRTAPSLIAAALLALPLLAVPAAAEERVELPTRPGVTQPILYEAARAPVASVVLFPGGNGVVASVQANFLLRVRQQFVAEGLSVAVLDSPSDHPAGMGPPFRTSGLQAQDVAAVAAFLKGKAAVPVWLVGTSRGSISAANAAARLGPSQVAGAVLTSSTWAVGLGDVPLGQVAVPVLILHNRDDACQESPFSGAAPALDALARAPAKELVALAGGTAKSRPCEALSPHGYYGIEDKVVPAIVRWIKAHPPVR